jgi:hypothetical protein
VLRAVPDDQDDAVDSKNVAAQPAQYIAAFGLVATEAVKSSAIVSSHGGLAGASQDRLTRC